MTTAKHTPRPWYRNIKAGGKYPAIWAGRNTHVAVAKGHGVLSPDEIEANIDLIAAAPDLLEALKGALKALDAIGHEMTVGELYTNAGQYLIESLDPARAAIAKAKGETS